MIEEATPTSLPWEQSDDISELTKAMVAANANFTHPKRNAENDFLGSRYATLSAVIDAYRPAYTAAGLAIMQLVTRDQLTTIVSHVSGQFLRFSVEISPAKAGIQAFGSSITYLRRYTILALTGIAVDDDDDDGQGATLAANKPPPAPAAASNKYKKAEVVDVQATEVVPRAEQAPADDLIDLMLGTKTQAELDALSPRLSKLEGAARATAIGVYRTQRDTMAAALKAAP